MSEPFNIKLEAAQKRAIQNQVSKKLAEISTHADDVLPEYVMVMVQNKKTREQVANDLVAFLGQELSNTFSIWLWKLLDDFLNGRLPLDDTTTNEDNNTMIDVSDIKQEEPPRTHLSSVIAVADNRHNNKRYQRRDRRYQEDRLEEDMLDEDSARSRSRELKLPTRMLLSAVQEAAESTSKNIRVLPEAKEMDMEEKEDNAENDNNSERRLLRSRRREKIPDIVREHSQDPVKFTVTFEKRPKRSLEASEDTDSANEMQAQELKKLKKIRCSFWPTCQKGELCLYHHPTEPCRNFPNCSYGESCLYIHPSVPCKFGTKCTRKGCAYQHPPPVFSKPRTRTPVLCKFGISCNKGTACPFKHPARNNNKTLVAGKIPCKFGAKCTNKDNCKFSHDDDMNGVTDTTSMTTEATTALPEPNIANMNAQSESTASAMQ